MSNPSIQQAADSYNNFVNNVQDVDQNQLQGNIDTWKNSSGDPFMLMNVWLTKILDAGSVWDPTMSGGYAKGDASYLSVAGDQISNVSLQMQFTAAYSGPITQIQNDLANAQNGDPNNTSLNDIMTQIQNLQNGLTQNPSLFGGVNSTAYQQIDGALTDLNTQFSNIQNSGNWGTSNQLGTFLSDVSNKNDTTGAAGIYNTITQDLSTVSQSVQTINGTLQEQMQFNVGTQEQWESLAQTLMKSQMSIEETFVNNQKSS